MARWVGLFAAVAVCSGCHEVTVSGYLSVEDSAGVELATNLPGSVEAAERWTLEPEAVVEIGGGPSPEVPLFRVSDVAPLSDGGVAVGVETPPQAYVFDERGTRNATLGRQGGGPGEFTRVASVVPMAGDSVAVWDSDRRRVSVFTRDGAFAREMNLADIAPLGIMAAPNTDAPAAWTHLMGAPDGEFVLFSVGAFGPGEGVRRPEAPSYRVSPVGDVLATYGPFPGYQSYAGERTGVAPYPFGADTHGALSGDLLVVGLAEAPELRYYGPGGALVRIIRWPDQPRPVEGPLVEAWDSMLASWLEPMPEMRRDMMRDMFDRIPRPERFPAYAGVTAGEDGRIWVGDYVGMVELAGTPIDVRVPARTWWVFDAEGTLVAAVETPTGFEPHAVEDGRVWGVYRGELDVESVRAYALVRP